MDGFSQILMAHICDRTFLVFQSFGQHGRELITSEVALQLLSVLAEEHNILSMGPVSITKELDNIVIKVNHTAGTSDLFYIRIVRNGYIILYKCNIILIGLFVYTSRGRRNFFFQG